MGFEPMTSAVQAQRSQGSNPVLAIHFLALFFCLKFPSFFPLFIYLYKTMETDILKLSKKF